MQLPFTHSEFFDVFAAYNAALWPAAAALWLLSLAAVLSLARTGVHANHRALSALLAVHWAWSGAVYQAAFFTRINPAAWLFAGLFVLQAALFAWFGILQDRLRFSTGWSARHILGGLLVAYGLAYPLLNVALGLEYPRLPTFGVPCPTTIFTAGLLLAATRPPWILLVVPVLWSLIGGSAAVLFGVTADLMLLLAGACLMAFADLRHPQRRSRAGAVDPLHRRPAPPPGSLRA